MSDIYVGRASLSGSVNIPSSKSYGHRLLIESAASGCRVLVKGNLQGDDIAHTVGCLKAMGIGVERLDNGIMISPELGEDKNDADCPLLDAGESGSTLRFFLSLLPTFKERGRFTGQGELPNRPIGELLSALERLGVRHTSDRLPLELCGKLADKPRFELKNLKSSQEVSGLLMALPRIDGASLAVEGVIPSPGYVDITLETLKVFGVEYKIEGGVFTPKSGYSRDIGEVIAEGDWSSAAFMIAAGVLSGKTVIDGLKYPSAQPDSVVLELLQKAGARVGYDNGRVYAEKSALKAIEFDADGCPDLVPIMAVMLAYADGVSEISGVDRLRYKESDRIAAVIDLLAAFSIKATYADGSLYVYGGKPSGGGVADSRGDHRIAMSAAICACASSDGILIRNANCVSKSYADFYEDLIKLGGNIDER